MKYERVPSPFLRLALPLLALLIAGLVITTAAETPVFNKHQKAFYLSEQDLLFIRPGLNINIVGATIDAGGKITARFPDPTPAVLRFYGLEGMASVGEQPGGLFPALHGSGWMYGNGDSSSCRSSPRATSARSCSAESTGPSRGRARSRASRPTEP